MGKKRIVRAVRAKSGAIVRRAETIDGWSLRRAGREIEIERERSGRGWRHVVSRADVERFVELIDDWDELAEALSVIRLAAGAWTFGYSNPHAIAVRAFPRDMRVPMVRFDCFARRVLSLLEVPAVGRCFHFQPDTARAWQLLDVFMHELGHHVDMRSNAMMRARGGEYFAIRFAADRLVVLWPRYRRAFELR